MVLSKLKSWLFGDEKERKKSSDKDVAFGHSSENKEGDRDRIRAPTDFSGVADSPGFHKMRMARYGYKATRNGLLRLIIPEGATVFIPSSDPQSHVKKLRADEVYVDKIVQVHGERERPFSDMLLEREARTSFHDPNYRYRESEFHEPDKFDQDNPQRCSYGLHFFTKARGARRWFMMNTASFNRNVQTDFVVNRAMRNVQP